MNPDIMDPPRAHGAPLCRAILKRTPADFRVDEILGIECTGQGEHLLLQIQKTAMNTDEVVSLLQECYDVSSADIGYCGLKDRHSVSSQWISVRTPLEAKLFERAAQQYCDAQSTPQAAAVALVAEAAADAGQATQTGSETSYTGAAYYKSLRLLAAARHGRKLRRGAHSRNTFIITLHDVMAIDDVPLAPSSVWETRFAQISQHGFPNFIGAQRFGRGAQNLHRAQQWFANSRKRVSRQQRSLYLSSGRSALFNVVCAARVRDASWHQLRPGEPAVLDGSHSFFVPKPDSDESREASRRLACFDIHPSAPWWGRGQSPATHDCAAFEQSLLAPQESICKALEKAGLSMERRSLRARAQGFSHQWIDRQTLELRFSLAPGLFATTLLRELCEFEEPSRK